MASNQKDVKIKVETEAKLQEVQALENKINEIKRQKLQLDIQTNTAKLEEVKSRINEVQSELKDLKGQADVDDSKVKALENELSSLEGKKLDLEVAIEEGKLKSVESEIEDLDGTTIDVNVNNISAMEAVDQIGQGFDRLKQGASEVGQQMGTLLEAAGKQETNKTFLEMAVGADQAAKSMQTVNDIVQQLPGDDTAVQGLLSQAIAKDASLTTDTLSSIGTAYADYASAMSFYGKSSIEAQQDMTNYILAGNTAELERSPILASHIDKLKEANTIQERAQVLQEALNEEHWGGMSQQDTFNNKLETFNGMLERGKYNLGGMFQEGAKWGMDFVMQLDEASGGIVGMGIALAGFAQPLTDTIMGLGQMATGFRALKDAGDLIGLMDKLRGLKDTVLSAAEAMGKLGLKVLEAGFNALKAAGMWAVEKAQILASSIAKGVATVKNWLLAVSEWAVASPILVIIIALVALAAALIWAYYNVDWFRAMVDNAWASLVQFGQYLYGEATAALQWLGDMFNNVGQIIQDSINNAINFVITTLQGLWNYIMTLGGLLPEQVNITGNQVIDGILAVMMFMATLPIQIAMIFLNIIAEALGFGNNFTQTLVHGAVSAVTGFIGKIQDGVNQFASVINGIKTALQNCLDWAYNMVMNHPLVQALKWLGEQAVNAFSVLGMGQGSPGDIYKAMKNELNWTQDEVKNSSLPDTMAGLGSRVSGSFNPQLSSGNSATGGNGGDIVINIYGDVDEEAKLERFAAYIRRELNWNNKTAGRSV